MSKKIKIHAKKSTAKKKSKFLNKDRICPRTCKTLPCSPHPERVFLGIIPQKYLELGIWLAMALGPWFPEKAWPGTLVYSERRDSGV